MRLLTRSDFDGLICAAILEQLGIIDDIHYIHPKDIQDGKINVTQNDVLANVPFAEGCGLWFDHHSSENERLEFKDKFNGASEPEPSAARVIYNYYIKNESHAKNLTKLEEMINAADKADSAQFSKEEILNPQGWVMLALIADPRTGLGYRHTFRISNFDLMRTLPGLLRTKSIDEILAMPDFQERIIVYHDETMTYQEFILEYARIEGDAILLDLRGIENIPSGNRFVEYSLFPDQNISVRLTDGKERKFVMISVGHSIIKRTSMVDVGSLMLTYGGGGHLKVGTCQVPYDEANKIFKEILDVINKK